MATGTLYAGFVGFYHEPLADRQAVRRMAELILDDRWPWPMRWARFAQRVKPLWSTDRLGGKRGIDPLVDSMLNPRRTTMRAYFSPKDAVNTASIRVNLAGDEFSPAWDDSFQVRGAVRVHDLPPGKQIDAWLGLTNDMLGLLKVDHAIITVFRTYWQVWGDVSLSRIVIDNRGQPEIDLGPTGEFNDQNDDLIGHRSRTGRTYVRHPRWGNYWLPEHVEKVGGIERIREAVQPAKIEQVGHLIYIQLLPTMEDALTPAYAEKRHALQAIMGSICVPPREKK